MTTNAQNEPDFNQVNADVFDFFKKTSQSWMDIINKSLVKTGDAGESGASGPVMEMMKQWPSWQNGAFNNANGQQGALQKMLAFCLEQQKLYLDLTRSGFTCAAKTMETLRNGAQSRNDPAETIKACRELAEDYCRSCAAFIESECSRICQGWGIPGAKEEKSGKTETAKSKA